MKIRFTYANVASTLALMITMTGGAAYAANTVRSADIVDGEVKTQDLGASAVTSPKVKNDSLVGADLADGSITADDLGTGSVGVDEIQVGALPQLTYQNTVATPLNGAATKELVSSCARTAQSAVTGGGFFVSPNITGISVQRSYAVSTNSWLVRVTAAPGTADWQLTVVADCIQ